MNKIYDVYVNIIGAGLAGMSAAIDLAKKGCHVRLFSVQASERAASNLAEGGINGALDVMGENDSIKEHYNDTIKGGCYLANSKMVDNLVSAAPPIIYEMQSLGVPFHRENGHIVQRNFGGQKKKRTAYAMSSTGKVLTVALINEVRKHESSGMVQRYCHHRFDKLILDDDGKECVGIQVTDTYKNRQSLYFGNTIIAVGGLNGFFSGLTTGTTANTGFAQAVLFNQGVEFANLEFVQYHPTTVAITGKRMLISEAARGEGGRLFYKKDDGSNCYFMEDKYGERGNLMPRDVISKEMAILDTPVYLDLTGLSDEIWKTRLSDMRAEIIHYLAIDPASEPVLVSPGIHYFMGGILVDENHETNIKGLYAAGECACAYHGANRLGGNSLLGAIFGGKKSAACVYEYICESGENNLLEKSIQTVEFSNLNLEEKAVEKQMTKLLKDGLGIIRDEKTLLKIISEMDGLIAKGYSYETNIRLEFAKAMLMSALNRRETRGAHVRIDYPDTDEAFRKTTVARFMNNNIEIYFKDVD